MSENQPTAQPSDAAEPETTPVATGEPHPGTTAPPPPPYGPAPAYGPPPPERRGGRLNTVAAWVGIVAGVVFIVAIIFCTGFMLGVHSGGGHRGGWDKGDRHPGMMFRHGGPPPAMMPLVPIEPNAPGFGPRPGPGGPNVQSPPTPGGPGASTVPGRP